MGYRSEVAFCLRVKEPEQFIALTRVNAEDALKEMLDNMYYMEGADEVDYILFTHNYWKWYGDSEKAFAELMGLAENYDEDFACKFARVGENADDIEEEAFGEDGWDLEYPYVVRTLEVGVKSEFLKPVIEKEKEDVSA
jgi:hypothetical protein